MKDRSELKGGLETRKGGKVFDPYDDIKKACGCNMGRCKCNPVKKKSALIEGLDVIGNLPKTAIISDSAIPDDYAAAVARLREIADEREAMFDGRTFKMVAAIKLTDSIKEIRRVADLLEKDEGTDGR